MKTKVLFIFTLCFIISYCKENEKEIILSSEWDDKGVSNNKFFRFLSDLWDAYLGPDFDKFAPRNIVHTFYHFLIGVVKYFHKNFEGALAEWKRANEQYQKFLNNVKPLNK